MADKNSAQKIGGLRWVKSEIGTTLIPFQELLETGISTASAQDFTISLRALDQVQGVLLALQLFSAARLTQELRQLTEHLSDVSNNDPTRALDAVQIMRRAVIQFTNHLDRLDAGFNDPPLSLWATINEIRAANDQAPLTQSELLACASVTLDEHASPESLESVAEVMRQVRPQFHRHLVTWYKGDQTGEGLSRLRSLFQQVFDFLKKGIVSDAIQIAAIFAECLLNGELEVGQTARSLMGHLDKIFKAFVQKPPRWPENEALELLDQILQILNTEFIDSPALAELQARYRPLKSNDDVSKSNLYQTDDSDATLARLATSVLTEFGSLKEQFRQLAYGDARAQDTRQIFVDTLQRLAATLAETTSGKLPERLLTIADGISALKKIDFANATQQIEDFATELLSIEAVLQAYANQRPVPLDQILAPDMDLSELTAATLREASYELVRIKEAIAACHAEGGALTALQSIPDYLISVAGALSILGEATGGELAEGIGNLVQTCYLDARRTPAGIEFEHLADAVAALEYYINHLLEAQPFGDTLIDRAEESLAALEYILGGGGARSRAPIAPARENSGVTTKFLSAPIPTQSSQRGSTVSNSVALTSSVSSTSMDQQESIADPASTSTPAIDPEFLEIFLEEAQEEIASAQTQFAQWESNPGDAVAIGILRRSFHTLKGSGRLVHAYQIGDFAQALEYLLNSLIDSRAFPSEEVLALVAEAVELLPELVSAEASGQRFNITPIVSRANRLREEQLKNPRSSEPTTQPINLSYEPHQPDKNTEEQVTDRDSLFLADEELLKIFQAETHEHLDSVRKFLKRADAGDTSLDEPPVRALHTITGSARMAGIDSIANVTKALELYLKPILAAGADLRVELVDLLRKVVAAVEERVDELPVRGSGVKALLNLVKEISALPPPILEPLDLPQQIFTENQIELKEQYVLTEVNNSEKKTDDINFATWNFITENVIESDTTTETEFASIIQEDTQVDSLPNLEPNVNLTNFNQCAELQIQIEQINIEETQPFELMIAEDAKESPIFQAIEPTTTQATQTIQPVKPPSEDINQAIDVNLILEDSTQDCSLHEVAATIEHNNKNNLQDPTNSANFTTDTQDNLLQPIASEIPKKQDDAASNFIHHSDPEMVSLFLEDARDLLDKLDTQFRAWQFTPHEVKLLDGINRLLHTLKGSARLTGMAPIGDLSHALETRLKSVIENPDVALDATLELSQRAVDALAIQVDAVEQNAPIPCLNTLVKGLGNVQTKTDPEAFPTAQQKIDSPINSNTNQLHKPINEHTNLASTDVLADLVHAREGTATGAAIQAASQIRVRADLLNRLVNHAGEISIYRGRLTQRNGQLSVSLNELDQTVVRLREKLRQLEIETQVSQLYFSKLIEREEDPQKKEFDTLELDRYYGSLQQLSGSLNETVNDLVSVKEMLGGYQREFTDLLTQQARLADDLQDGLLRTRLVPFIQVVPRLQRLVRQTADSLGKSAQLIVTGPEVELDRTILDRLVAPLEHLLRNAVDHGVELPEVRLAANKPAQGTITLALRREGNDAVIELSDNGKGVDLAAIRRQAINRGLLAPDVQLPDSTLLQFIFEPGFTTSGKITQISGRGVGLDVVVSEIKSANGNITLESVPGQGARFTIRLPLTLAIIDAFLITAGENMYALPHNMIEAAARIHRDELLAIYRGERKEFLIRDQIYKVVYLGGVLDPLQEPDFGERRWLPLLLTRFGEQRIALHVDNLLESQRILVKPLGPQLAGVRWLSGGTILPDGRVAFIIDVLALLRSGALQEYRPAVATSETSITETPCVMVVDDSLTVRRVTSRLLQREHMEVITAKDGVEALTLLDERIPNLILMDVEMPRMDGYELTRHIRRSELLHNLPIIMITSRTGTKHRDYAIKLGVNKYLGKPYQEKDLLDEVKSLLNQAR